MTVLNFLISNSGSSVPVISKTLGIPIKSIERHISVLIAKGLIERRGSKKTGGYFIKAKEQPTE